MKRSGRERPARLSYTSPGTVSIFTRPVLRIGGVSSRAAQRFQPRRERAAMNSSLQLSIQDAAATPYNIMRPRSDVHRPPNSNRAIIALYRSGPLIGLVRPSSSLGRAGARARATEQLQALAWTARPTNLGVPEPASRMRCAGSDTMRSFLRKVEVALKTHPSRRLDPHRLAHPLAGRCGTCSDICGRFASGCRRARYADARNEVRRPQVRRAALGVLDVRGRRAVHCSAYLGHWRGCLLHRSISRRE